ncbi:myoD family inhibitor domain-containing protein 2-like [Brachionichthys hirsutus]|uniref:myoD family inhibitor domain-containing protein 2-like n=1 Tax=Brachionichthys hirsutus TaxID=412623 RepID=UPI003604C383
MTTPFQLPVNDEDYAELQTMGDLAAEDGGIPPIPVMSGPSKTVSGSRSAGGMRKLSTIAEQESDKLDNNPGSEDSQGSSESGGSSFSVCSDKFRNGSSHFPSDDSYQPDSGDDCAGLLLACLHCRFHDLMVLLPDTCERAVSRCFPSYRYIRASFEREQQGQDCCDYKLELDCSCCGSCEDAGELVELAMEISEVCYR